MLVRPTPSVEDRQITPGPDPIKYFQRRVTLHLNLRILIGCQKSGDHFQPMRGTEIQRSVNLSWNFLYRIGSYNGAILLFGIVSWSERSNLIGWIREMWRSHFFYNIGSNWKDSFCSKYLFVSVGACLRSSVQVKLLTRLQRHFWRNFCVTP